MTRFDCCHLCKNLPAEAIVTIKILHVFYLTFCRCAPGYYGNPLKQGGYCQKCNCPDNGQLMNCDRLTGGMLKSM